MALPTARHSFWRECCVFRLVEHHQQMRRLQGDVCWQAFVREEEDDLATEAERWKKTLYQLHCCGGGLKQRGKRNLVQTIEQHEVRKPGLGFLARFLAIYWVFEMLQDLLV